MVTMASADSALKTLYLGVVSEQLNTECNPLLSKIKQTTQDVWGKEIRRVASYGVNGGVGAGTEDGNLPVSAGNNYEQFICTLKNLYGTIEISDKAMRASENDAGAFVNLLNAEMEGLVKAASFNFGRMLFGDGSGKLCAVMEATTSGNVIEVDDLTNLVEGMMVEIYDDSGNVMSNIGVRRIINIDRKDYLVTLSGPNIAVSIPEDATLYVQGSKDQEITGLGAIFKKTGTLYGLDRATHKWLVPYMKENVGVFSEGIIQEAIDYVEQTAGGSVNFIICSPGVRRAYLNWLRTYKRSVNTLDLENGFKAISYNGIPVVVDRFCPKGKMFLLNTDDFALHQLCDWKWLEGEDGKVIKQIAGKPTYSATLVKYADLICTRPSGQAMLSGIREE